MEITEQKYFKTRAAWRSWLEKNFRKKKEIWFVFPSIASGKKMVSYNDAVEEALCFGWIDSIVKKLDDDHRVQRFTPRKSKNNFSQPNIERLKWLLARKLVHPDVEKEVAAIVKKKFVFPKDIVAKLKADPLVWKNYRKFPESYRRIRIAYIDGVRDRPDEFRRRLKSFIEKTKQGKRIGGYGGVDKYY